MEVERERRRIAAAERNKGGKKTKGSVLRKVRMMRIPLPPLVAPRFFVCDMIPLRPHHCPARMCARSAPHNVLRCRCLHTHSCANSCLVSNAWIVAAKEEERNPESASRSDGSEGIFQNKRAKKTEGIRAPYVGRHVHTWDSEWSEGGEGGGATIWKKKCSGCGLVQKFEKL